jgi:hypothetical protein
MVVPGAPAGAADRNALSPQRLASSGTRPGPSRICELKGAMPPEHLLSESTRGGTEATEAALWLANGTQADPDSVRL